MDVPTIAISGSDRHTGNPDVRFVLTRGGEKSMRQQGKHHETLSV